MEYVLGLEADNMVPCDNEPLPRSAIMALSGRAKHVLERMSFPKTYGGIRGVTYEQVLAEQNSGEKTAREIMDFREKCLDGTIVPQQLAALVRPDDTLPPVALEKLTRRARRILDEAGVEKTPRGICGLDRQRVKDIKGAGSQVADELMKLRERCLNGSVWEDEVIEPGIHPLGFGSLSDYVMAVAKKTRCQIDEQKKKILAEHMGLLNVEQVKNLREMGEELGISHEAVRQAAKAMAKKLFSDEGKAIFAEFVDCAKSLFSQRGWVVKKGELVGWVNSAYPNWTGTTEFSVIKLLEGCGSPVAENASGRMAWMADGRIDDRYKTYRGLLNDESVPLEELTKEAVLRNADSLGLDGITEDEYYYFEQCFSDRRDGPRRDTQFARARARRKIVAKVLRKAGIKGLKCKELFELCRTIDPASDIVDFKNRLDGEARLRVDMGGTGARLLVYDYTTHTYTLDEFFSNDELIRVLRDAGERLRKRMEENGVGVAAITRLVDEINAELPEPYASIGLPSGCIYNLMREHGVAGLQYFDHPNVAHPDIKRPDMALSWVIYEYFLHIGRKEATRREMFDFCEQILGTDFSGSNGAVQGVCDDETADEGGVNDYTLYRLKPPDENIEPPQVLLQGGKFDYELSFSKPRTWEPQGMNRGADGKALDFSTYVRSFLLKLKESGYAFSGDEEAELADQRWCGENLSLNKPVILRARPGSERPNTTYWRVCYNVGQRDYWVNSYWPDRCKPLFDKWAQSIASRAGFTFEPYDLP